ncbi:MAG: hypothetical protein WC494_03825 [Candidatus Pacearchaeota archaeon]
MSKIDPYKHKEKYFNWKERVIAKGVPGISKANSDTVIKYVTDMESGLNVSIVSQKGARSYTRLNNLRQRLLFLSKQFETHLKIEDMRTLTEEQVITYFTSMRNGTIKRVDGAEYQSVVDFVKNFKAFWHWHIKVSKKQGIEIPDITTDLDTSKTKPHWVYLTEEQIKKLCDSAKFEYRVLIMFLFDSGIRSPTELINIKVSDFYDNYKELMIRDEVSKTFGRRIKLLLSAELVKEYVLKKSLKPEDHIFDIKGQTVNKYLQRLAKQLFGDGKSPAGKKYSDLTMYHFRHCSCCYWLPRYKSESALKYRFGWKKSDKIHYYSELLGMSDTISEEDLLLDVTKTELEKRLIKTEKDKGVLQDRVNSMEKRMEQILAYIKQMDSNVPCSPSQTRLTEV